MIQCGYIEYILIENGLKRYIHPTTKFKWTLKLSFKLRNLLVVTHGGVFYFYLKREYLARCWEKLRPTWVWCEDWAGLALDCCLPSAEPAQSGPVKFSQGSGCSARRLSSSLTGSSTGALGRSDYCPGYKYTPTVQVQLCYDYARQLNWREEIFSYINFICNLLAQWRGVACRRQPPVLEREEKCWVRGTKCQGEWGLVRMLTFSADITITISLPSDWESPPLSPCLELSRSQGWLLSPSV